MPPTTAPHDRDRDPDRDRHAWIAPLVSTLVTVPAALVALLLTAWLLSARRKHAPARVLLALVAPFVVAALGLAFVERVDRP
ncbi:hypothetical protein ACFVW2_08280 [Streptomyces sp. NPDC058171]